MSDKAGIYKAFVQAQKEFAPALKTSNNPHFKSRYVDLAGCVEAVIDALNNHGIGLIQRTLPDETGVTVETVFVHESGEQMDGGRLHVPAAKHDPQGYGSALTYCRRYSLMAACGIAPEDDDGNAASTKPPARPATKPAAKPHPVDIPTLCSALQACETLASLKDTFAKAWIESGHNAEVKKCYDHRKAELEAA
jgi:hypothetical protein